MQSMGRLFSPTALAATVASGLLVTAGVAYAVDQISVSAQTSYFNCQVNETSCQTLLFEPGVGTYSVYFCCPAPTTCSSAFAEYDPATGKIWAWCNQAGDGGPPRGRGQYGRM